VIAICEQENLIISLTNNRRCKQIKYKSAKPSRDCTISTLPSDARAVGSESHDTLPSVHFLLRTTSICVLREEGLCSTTWVALFEGVWLASFVLIFSKDGFGDDEEIVLS